MPYSQGDPLKSGATWLKEKPKQPKQPYNYFHFPVTMHGNFYLFKELSNVHKSNVKDYFEIFSGPPRSAGTCN